MALMQKYLCPKCGFEIMAEDNFHYGLMSGEYAYFKCSKCKCISEKRLPYWADFSIMTIQNEMTMKEIEKIQSDGRCDNCGKIGALTPWAPRLGCPKCECELFTDGVEICVD